MPNDDIQALIQRGLEGERRAIAKLVSIVEDGAEELAEVTEAIFGRTGNAFTVGITGAPGAGKSTLTEGLIGRVRGDSHSVGVLAIDPSSPFTGGALLGDRVRMQSHTSDEQVFIRSMATRGHLGGLSLATPQAVRILDAAGMDYIIIETVGVGQDEVEIVESADTTVVVVNPGWGDSVQAGKAGLLEIGDIFVVNKADRDGADQTVRELNQMIDFGPKRPWRPPVIKTVAVEGSGLAALWEAIKRHLGEITDSGELARRRSSRITKEIIAIVAERVRERMHSDLAGPLEEAVDSVAAKQIGPYAAARSLLDKLGIE